MVQQQSHGTQVLNNEKGNKTKKISYGRSLGGKTKPEWKAQFRTKKNRLAKVMTPSSLCVLIGMNKVPYDRLDCSYGDSVHEAQLEKGKRK